MIFTAEQEDLRQSVRRFLQDKSPESEVRRLMGTTAGYDPAVWRQMADQLGLTGLTIPEEYGGIGATYAELTVVLEEMGRRLLCSPYFATVALATNLLLLADDEAAKKTYLPSLATGETIATVALVEQSGRWDEDGVQLVAANSESGWRLTGEKHYVLDGHIADLILVGARSAAGVSVFIVERDAPGLDAEPLPTLDETRKQATVRFQQTPARLIGQDGAGWAPISRMLDLAAVALAAEQVGGAQAALDMAVEYAKVRVQFGRPIGSFQAVKHICADMLIEVESARSAAYTAGRAAADEDDELPVLASLAKTYCSRAYSQVTADNIQVHGGIGFTWENAAHLYFKRAKSSELLFGDPDYHRDQLATRLGL